jgi:hypothetical protein
VQFSLRVQSTVGQFDGHVGDGRGFRRQGRAQHAVQGERVHADVRVAQPDDVRRRIVEDWRPARRAGDELAVETADVEHHAVRGVQRHVAHFDTAAHRGIRRKKVQCRGSGADHSEHQKPPHAERGAIGVPLRPRG